MRDEPKHAAHFGQKIAGDLANSLSNHNGRMSICHVQGEVASLRDAEKDKVHVWNVEALKHSLCGLLTGFNVSTLGSVVSLTEGGGIGMSASLADSAGRLLAWRLGVGGRRWQPALQIRLAA